MENNKKLSLLQLSSSIIYRFIDIYLFIPILFWISEAEREIQSGNSQQQILIFN